MQSPELKDRNREQNEAYIIQGEMISYTTQTHKNLKDWGESTQGYSGKLAEVSQGHFP